MKRFLAVVLCIVMCVSSAPSVSAVDSGADTAADIRDIGFETDLAIKLKGLGLFQGVGEGYDGTADFDLNRTCTRTEAVVMLVRALGKGAEAEAYTKTHPFTDVPVWADGYVSYAYDNGLTNGISDTLFGAEDTVTAEMYLTFMLRALGYKEGTYEDFSYDAPIALASWCGLLPQEVDTADFKRAGIVVVTCAALFSAVKGTQTTLHERLVENGTFTGEQFEAAFTTDPFLRMRQIDRVITEEFPAHEQLGKMYVNYYGIESHIVTDMAEADGVLTVTAFVAYSQLRLEKGGYILGGDIGWTDLWLLKLDAETLQLISCRTGSQFLKEDGLKLEDCFSQKSIEARQSLRMSLRQINTVRIKAQIAGGEIAYKQPTYEDSMEKARGFLTDEMQTLETDQCTIMMGHYGQLKSLTIFIVYKSGSVAGEGETERITTHPDTVMWRSEDGLTLYYSYHFENGAVYAGFAHMGPSEYPDSGTCNNTIDLNTRETSYEIIED